MSAARQRVAAIYPYDPTSPSRIRSLDTLKVLATFGEVTVFAPDLDNSAVETLAALGCLAVTQKDSRMGRVARIARALLTGRSITFAFYRPIVPTREQFEQFDLVFSERCPLPEHARMRPVVVDLVDNFQRQVEQLARTAPLPRRYGYVYDTHFIRKDILRLCSIARVVLCTTRNESDGLQRLGVPARKLLPYLHLSQVEGLAGKEPEDASGYGPRQLAVFHGRQSYPANQAAVERLRTVAAANPSWEFLVFGEGWPPSMAQNIEFRAFQQDLSLLLDCSLGVYPVEVAVGVQNKVLEALAAGLPVLVTPQVYAGLPEAVKEPLRDRILVRDIAQFHEGLKAACGMGRSENAAEAFRNAYSQVIEKARAELADALRTISNASA